MTIIFEAQNANEDFVKLVKSAAKLANIKIKTQKKEDKQDFYTLENSPALKQIKNDFKKLPQETQEQLKNELEIELSNANHNN